MTGTCQSLTALFGRIFISAIFLLSGFGKIADWSGTSAGMEKEGMIAVPLFLVGAIALEVLGGLSVLLGFLTRYGAAALVVFLVPTTLIFHDFWAYAGPEQHMQMIQFMKNLALLGGILMVAAFGPGRYSLDHRRNSTNQSLPTRIGHNESVPVG